MPRRTLNLFISMMIFAVSLGVGVWLSLAKPLWNDEIFTQWSIQKMSYSTIVSGKFSEGNNCPLFYLIQKFWTQTLGFLLILSDELIWEMADPVSQCVMRFPANCFMSLSLAVLFYVFSCLYSRAVGIWAFFYCLSLLLFWEYWAESRPYALWFFLTILQSLLIVLFQYVSLAHRRLVLWGLWIVHFLLALTISIGLAQIVMAIVVCFFGRQQKENGWIQLHLLPLGVGFYYYLMSPKFKFWFDQSPLSLMLEAIPLEWLLCCLLAVVSVFFNLKQKPQTLLPQRQQCFSSLCQSVDKIFLFLGAMLTVACGLVVFLLAKAGPMAQGFAVSHRYFLFLSAIGVVAMTVLTQSLYVLFKKNRWMLININLLLGGLLVFRMLKTYQALVALRFY